MDKIKLIRPTLEFGEDIMLFRKELIETNDNDTFAGCGSLRQCLRIGEW